LSDTIEEEGKMRMEDIETAEGSKEEKEKSNSWSSIRSD
jgi:hypothetical protein